MPFVLKTLDAHFPNNMTAPPWHMLKPREIVGRPWRRHARGGLRPLRCRPPKSGIVVAITKDNWQRRLRRRNVRPADALWKATAAMFAPIAVVDL